MLLKKYRGNKDKIIKEEYDWKSIKREKIFREVYNDKMVDLIKKKFIKKIKHIQKEKINKYKVDNPKAQKGTKFKGGIGYKMHNQKKISLLTEINAQYKNIIDYIKKLNATLFIG